MPLKPHPTDPDKMVYVSRQYDMPDTPSARAYLDRVLDDDDIQVYKKPWVDLTKEEKDACVLSSMYHTAWSSDIDVGTLIEVVSAKLKEKNNDF
tara:strand:+ start:721 stop:1002 length:282 start_codon:yes stop_codon:yes gene_type:complete